MIVKMLPAYKDNLWGGNRLKTAYHKETGLPVLAESWEFSTHPDGLSSIQSPGGDRQPFSDFLRELGGDPVGQGWGAEFPLLVKFIDSRLPLSIQVHPDDTMARRYGERFGKTEMWHILEAQPGAFLYMGLKEDLPREVLDRAIESRHIESLLNRVEVEPGDNFLIPAGTLHSIGAGITLVEIQQMSNLTFRVYDFDRRDKEGKLRPLHLKEAREAASNQALPLPGESERKQDIRCPLFQQFSWEVRGKMTRPLPSNSFLGVIIVDGSGQLEDGESSWQAEKGDSFFLPNRQGKGELALSGQMSVVAFTL